MTATATAQRRLDVESALRAALAILAAHREELDALNVFPVPDGDTGANVVATLQAATEAVASVDAGDDVRAVAVSAALRGARGNSGVLISQVLRGLLQDAPSADVLGEDLAARLVRADELARQAVAEPVEGSLLSATRAAAVAASEGGETEQLERARAAAHVAVDATQTQLEVLRRAGVVDAGARAFALVLEGLAAAARGEAPDPPAVEVPPDGPASVTSCGVDGGRYEVMYLLDALSADSVRALRAALVALGDSVVVVSAPQEASVHVHTDDIGGALEAALPHGAPRNVRVEDLTVGIVATVRPADGSGAHHPALGGLVVGVSGPGAGALAEDAGAVVLTVEPGRLPDVGEVLAAADRAGGERVAVLPGHPHVVPTAMQAARVRADAPDDGPAIDVVVRATSTPAVLAALAVVEPGAPDAVGMDVVAGAVTAGEVVAAVREARTAAGPVAAGDWLGVVAGEVVAIARSADAAVDGLLDGLAAAPPEPGATPDLVQLLVGADADPELAALARRCVSDRWPTAEVEVVAAGQRPAVLVVGVEWA